MSYNYYCSNCDIQVKGRECPLCGAFLYEIAETEPDFMTLAAMEAEEYYDSDMYPDFDEDEYLTRGT